MSDRRDIAAIGVRALLLVAVGSAMGGLARALLSLWMRVPAGSFPWDTWSANLLGSMLVAALARTMLAPDARWPSRASDARLFAMVGFCGGFTTFSVFSLESLSFWQAGQPQLAAVYVGTSLIAWLAGAVAGWLAGGQINARGATGRG